MARADRMRTNYSVFVTGRGARVSGERNAAERCGTTYTASVFPLYSRLVLGCDLNTEAHSEIDGVLVEQHLDCFHCVVCFEGRSMGERPKRSVCSK